MEMTQSEIEALLTERELREYQIYMRLKQPPMAPSIAAGFYQLFLNYGSCEEIIRLNPGGFSLGAVVRARIEGKWDEHAREHRVELFAKIRDKVAQVQMETVDRLLNEMVASNKLINDKVLRYIQTGDSSEVESYGVGSLKHLLNVADLVQRLTGQTSGEKKPLRPPEQPPAKVVTAEAAPIPQLPADKEIAPEQAANALSAILKSRQK